MSSTLHESISASPAQEAPASARSTQGSTGSTRAEASGAALRDHVVESLTDAIVNQDYAPGQVLRERTLSELYGVSRVPVREALLVLQAQGLVAMEPRMGARVTDFTAADVRDLFDVREALEPLAARLAATAATAADLERLAALVEQARTAHTEGNPAQGSLANTEFHLAIIEAAHSPLLTACAAPLASQLRRLFRLTIEAREESLNHAHEDLLQALHRREAELAGLLAHTHVVATRAPSLALFESTPDAVIIASHASTRG